MLLELIKRILNRKTLLIGFILVFITGFSLAVIGTLPPDENVPVRIEFSTYSQYTAELNSFFNRTEQNKLIENYTVRGYAIVPKTAAPPEGYPVIIWMHGFAVSAEMQMNYPRLFAKCGFLSIAISQPGHGCSGGYWDMGIQALLGVYSTVEWLVNESPYRTSIDKNRIAVSGHSMGGIVTTRSGIFDNWTNPNTSNPVGTGGLIRSYCAIYCWDDLYSMADTLINDFLGLQDVWNHPAILRLMESWRWLSNHDPSTIEEETRLRSVSNFITGQNIPNYCLITGSGDELTTVKAQCHIMANSTINASGIIEVPWNVIYNQVNGSSNHTWNYGDISAGNARRFVLVPGIGHIQEAFDQTIMQNAVLWLNESMNCTNINTNVPSDINLFYLVKLSGWFLMLIGALGCILPTFSYFSKSKLKVESPRPKIAPNLQIDRQKLLLYSSIPIAVIALSSLIGMQSLTHFWIFDLMIPKFLVSALLLLPIILILVILEMKRYHYTPEDIGLTRSIKNNLKSILLPVLAILICVLIFDVVSWFLQLPFLLPRPFDSGIYIDFFMLFGILLLQNFCFELLFRGLYQTKIEQYGARQLTQWTIIFRSGLFSGIVIGSGFGLNLLISIGGLFANSPFFIILLFGGIIFLFFVIGIVSAFIYQRTRNILSSTFFNALLMALFISGKLFLTYA
ncbi:MAG: hypothetical protein HWN66_01200 [Candidatus Helarchaeota archaeon]|nr:hypothetical protein [Candidatus Helarchaeota archaeon]